MAWKPDGRKFILFDVELCTSAVEGKNVMKSEVVFKTTRTSEIRNNVICKPICKIPFTVLEKKQGKHKGTQGITLITRETKGY